MKIAHIAVLLIGLLSAPAWAGPGAKVYELGVDGLGCPFCAYGIEKELGSLEGVDKVEIDIKRAVAVVTMAEGAALDEDTAKQAVEHAGFDLRSFGQASQE